MPPGLRPHSTCHLEHEPDCAAIKQVMTEKWSSAQSLPAANYSSAKSRKGVPATPTGETVSSLQKKKFRWVKNFGNFKFFFSNSISQPVEHIRFTFIWARQGCNYLFKIPSYNFHFISRANSHFLLFGENGIFLRIWNFSKNNSHFGLTESGNLNVNFRQIRPITNNCYRYNSI